MKTREREKARFMRAKQGRSIKEIARLLDVSRSTVSLWVGDIELTARQSEALRRRNPILNRQLNGAAANVERGRARRRAYQADGRRRAKRLDALFVAGCMLYWAEGAKSRNQVRLSNSDPALISFFVRFLRRHFEVGDSDLRIKLHLFADHLERQRDVEGFWLGLLGLSRANLQKSYVNVYSRASKKKRVNKLPHGTCNVIVNDTRIVQAIYGGIQELGAFDRPAWLD